MTDYRVQVTKTVGTTVSVRGQSESAYCLLRHQKMGEVAKYLYGVALTIPYLGSHVCTTQNTKLTSRQRAGLPASMSPSIQAFKPACRHSTSLDTVLGRGPVRF